MPPTIQIWLPPLLSMLGSMIVVVFAAWLNTKVLSAQIDALRSELKADIAALRAEMKQGFAELRLEFHKEISALANRVERLENRVGRLEDRVGRLEDAVHRSVVRP